MYEDFALSARERGYKQPGVKLKPRCAYDDSERTALRCHSMRELRRKREAEGRAMTELYVKHEGFDPSVAAPHWRKMHKAMDALNSRSRRRVERALWGEEHTKPLAFVGRAMARALRAAQECDSIERCIDADEKLLRYALG